MNPIADFNELHSVEQATNERAYVYLIGKFAQLPSRKALKKALKAKRLVNTETGQALTELTSIEKGMVIGLKASDAPLQTWAFPLKVLYEDDELAVVFKPSGITTGSAKRRCLKNALPFNLRKSTEKGALLAPLPVHRLDHATEGLVVCAKTAFALVDLGQQFEAGTIVKLYVAHVHGWFKAGLVLDSPIDGKVAITSVVSVEHRTHKTGAKSSLLVLKPHQGRTHQLRIHLSRAGHSIIGDTLYGSSSKGKLRLKAMSVQFIHPRQQTSMTIAS